jgi:hypothetical protein
MSTNNMKNLLNKTQILHFNLSGNHIFENEKPRIIIKDLGRSLEGRTEQQEAQDVEYYFAHHTTLRDIAILLYEACGQGVIWNLSRELAKELNIKEKDANIAIEHIIQKYAEITEKEALEKYNKLGTHINLDNP